MNFASLDQKFKNVVTFLKGIKEKGKNRILGFDLGAYSIKVAEVELVKNELILSSFVQARTYKNTILNGIINEPINLLEIVKALLWNLKISWSVSTISLPYDVVIFDYFKVDGLPEEEEIKSKINEEIPYKIEDVYFSYYIVPEKGNYKVFFLVVKKDLVDEYLKVFKNSNLKIESIDADFINLHNLSEFLQIKKPKVIIDWGYTKVKVLFYDKEYPMYGRELFNLGFQKLEKELIKNLGIAVNACEELIVNPEKGKTYSGFKKIYIDYLKEVVSEIKDTLEFFGDKFDLNTELVLVVGGGARIPGICDLLKDLLKIETTTFKVENKLVIPENFDPEYLKVVNTQGAIAVATAVREFL